MNIENKLPRICYVLGGEKTPLGLWEEFECLDGKFRINNNGIVERKSNSTSIWNEVTWNIATATDILSLINNSNNIIRSPQFSEDEKAFLRLLIQYCRPWIARDRISNCLYCSEKKPQKDGKDGNQYDFDGESTELPAFLFHGITFKNSPFNAADYLKNESE